MYLQLLIFLILIYSIAKYNRNFRYWKELGVPSLTAQEQRKNIWDLLMRKKAAHVSKREEYNKFEGERFYGVFNGVRHALVIRDDFELIKAILVKHFDNFGGSLVTAMADPANRADQIGFKSLPLICGEEWKTVR